MSNDNFFAAMKAAWRGKGPCLTLPDGRTLSYDAIDALSAKIAAALREAGARPGDRILAQVEKSSENVALYLAALRAGFVYVPLNTAYTAEEVTYFLGDADPSVFICDPAKEDVLAPMARVAGSKSILTLDKTGAGSLADAAAQAAAFNDSEPRISDHLASILYTSGTTGRPKGAILTHGNLASNAIALNELWGFTPNDVLLHALPIFHIHGLFVALHTAMLSGCEIVFLPKFDIAEIRRQLPRASVMMGVPTFYTRLLKEPDFARRECENIRLFISGSAPLTQETHCAFEKRTGHRILERYGMSEAGMIASNPLDGKRIAGTVGFALPGVLVRVTDGEGALAAVGVPENVEVKGPNIFKGYWRNPEKTREAFTRDGYFKTGDIGALDDEGRLTLAGRSKDLIIAGGYNIYPKEIEQILDAVPGIEESAVIAAPHPDMGEGAVAVLVAEGDKLEDDVLTDALSALAKFKRPRKFYWLSALPRNAMGKVQKQVLRERFKLAFA